MHFERRLKDELAKIETHIAEDNTVESFPTALQQEQIAFIHENTAIITRLQEVTDNGIARHREKLEDLK